MPRALQSRERERPSPCFFRGLALFLFVPRTHTLYVTRTLSLSLPRLQEPSFPFSLSLSTCKARPCLPFFAQADLLSFVVQGASPSSLHEEGKRQCLALYVEKERKGCWLKEREGGLLLKRQIYTCKARPPPAFVQEKQTVSKE